MEEVIIDAAPTVDSIERPVEPTVAQPVGYAALCDSVWRGVTESMLRDGTL